MRLTEIAESGFFYSTFIDPLLTGIRNKLAKNINKGESVIDVACGTGAQAFVFAQKAERVVGIDLSESMISCAKKESLKRDLTNVEFVVADAGNLAQFSNKKFDVAFMTLALHQFPPEYYALVLSEMTRVAKRIIIFDYAVPVIRNAMGYAIKGIEFLAGKEHNRCFKMYCKAGGLKSILGHNRINITQIQVVGKGAFHMVMCDVD